MKIQLISHMDKSELVEVKKIDQICWFAQNSEVLRLLIVTLAVAVFGGILRP
jgi:hypothetical protein